MTQAPTPGALPAPTHPATGADSATPLRWGRREGLAYGALGLPLAFVALPLYVLLPNLYAKTHGMALATLGAVLLGARLLDAVIDPWLGRWVDRGLALAPWRMWRLSALPALALALGVAALLLPPVAQLSAVGLWVWVGGWLVWTYTAYSLLTLCHQAWGASLGGDELLRGRIVAWREGLGLAGVVLASVLPGVLGLPATALGLSLCLGVAWWAWRYSPAPKLAPQPATATGGAQVPVWQPLTHAGFRRLWGVFVINGVASAIPATLVYFFMQDRLQLPTAWQSACLGLYFVAAAVGMPGWLALVPRLGLARSWCLGMGLSVAVFAWVSQLQAGDHLAYALICALSGLALGADLALPGALLAGLLPTARPQAPAAELHAGLALGWWNFAAKFNLALAAGLALPVLAWWGYAPGVQGGEGVQALSWAYGLLPCGLKLLAAALLWRVSRVGHLSSIRSVR